MCERSQNAELLADKPLRVMVPSEDDGPYKVVPFANQVYLTISYCWPSPGFRRLSTSTESTSVLEQTGLCKSEHFSKFMRTAVESHIRSVQKLNSVLPTAIWLDRHCINQSPRSSEKADQIAIMQHIYYGAQATLIMLEDVSISAEDLQLLRKNHPTDVHLQLIRYILSARWFTRAWCSQENVLSSKTIVCVHQTGKPEDPILFSGDLISHWLDLGRRIDASLPAFSQSKGMISNETWVRFGTNTSAWALGVVAHLGCSDPYDKVALVLNLLRRIYQFKNPAFIKAPGVDSVTIRNNVLKMVNILAIQHRDFSLLLLQHVAGNPLQGERGFGWAGTSLPNDKISEVWSVKDYDVANDTETCVDEDGLVIKGHLAKVVRQLAWRTWRDDKGFHVSVNGEQRDPPADWLVTTAFRIDTRLRLLRDLLYALEGFERSSSGEDTFARAVYGYLLDRDYHDQPDPFIGDLKTDMQQRFAGIVSIDPIHKDIANELDFIRRENDSTAFSTVLLDDGSILLVSGNCETLLGASLFQPHVIRPKMFSRPLILTANSMVLIEEPSQSQVFRCLGGVRGWGLISDTSPNVRIRII